MAARVAQAHSVDMATIDRLTAGDLDVRRALVLVRLIIGLPR
jgi:hypothetical protein